MRRSVVLGIGSALPKRKVTNEELAKQVDTSDQWIVERTGIRSRYVAGDGETTASLATDAARKATAQLAFWLTASLLLGAFCASLAATEGGGLRDGTWGTRRRTSSALRN